MSGRRSAGKPTPGRRARLADWWRSTMPSPRMQVLLTVLLLIAIAGLLVFRYLLTTHILANETMTPTYTAGERVLVNRLDTEPELGDVILFSRSGESSTVQRVVGVEGQTVEVADNVLMIDGLVAVEPYLDPNAATEDFGPIEVPPGTVFTMGDNREVAIDSRTTGPRSVDNIIGTVMSTFG